MRRYLILICLAGTLGVMGYTYPNENSSIHSALSSDTLKEQLARGKEVFMQNCVSCHQENGMGVMNLAPPLSQVEYVTGEKAPLIHILLDGFNEDVEINGSYYSNPMPSFDYLKDQEIADVLTYIRNNFENDSPAISAEEVAAQRKTK